MTKYSEILRLLSNELETYKVVDACRVSKKNVIKIKKRAAEQGSSWPLSDDMTDEKLKTILFPKASKPISNKCKSDFDYIRKELSATA